MYPDNNWYGHRSILLRYLGVKDQRIFGSFQHGWYKKNIDYTVRKFNTFIPYFAWNETIYKNAKKNRNNKVFITGSPFIYLDKLKKKKFKGKGVLFFPAHNYPVSEKNFHDKKIDYIKFNHIDYIKKIKKLARGPYTVSIYYSDFSKKIAKIYRQQGWTVKISGNRQDPKALDKLYNLINKSEYIISSEPSTSILYSLFLKKKTRIIFDKTKYKNTTYYKSHLNILKKKDKIYKDLYKKFVFGSEAINFANKELGYNHLKSKDELRNILGLNSNIKKIFKIVISKIIDFKYKKLRLSS